MINVKCPNCNREMVEAQVWDSSLSDVSCRMCGYAMQKDDNSDWNFIEEQKDKIIMEFIEGVENAIY